MNRAREHRRTPTQRPHGGNLANEPKSVSSTRHGQGFSRAAGSRSSCRNPRWQITTSRGFGGRRRPEPSCHTPARGRHLFTGPGRKCGTTLRTISTWQHLILPGPWTRDGRYLLFSRTLDRATELSEIVVLDLTTAVARPLQIVNRQIRQLRLHPDGRRLALVTGAAGQGMALMSGAALLVESAVGGGLPSLRRDSPGRYGADARRGAR